MLVLEYLFKDNKGQGNEKKQNNEKIRNTYF